MKEESSKRPSKTKNAGKSAAARKKATRTTSAGSSEAGDSGKPSRRYEIVALQIPVAFNKWGDHDHNGMLFALRENKEDLETYKRLFGSMTEEEWTTHEFYPLVRPLVLRANVGETVEIEFTNHIAGREVGIHLISDGYNVIDSDGADVGANDSSLAAYEQTRIYTWECRHEGTFVFHDAGNYSGMEDGTNLHGLFGALIVEPPNTYWLDSETGEAAADGLYVDVIPEEIDENRKTPWLSPPVKYPEEVSPKEPRKSFREYVVFFHDEVEFAASHETHIEDICHDQSDFCGNPPPAEHPFHPLMTISYRAEPMVARQRQLWKKINEKKLLAPVVHEEQHHSSWMFGDPATPVLKAYIGDPVRIRLIHAAVKETHVFHLHVYSWHHDPHNRNSPIIDSISIGPQTAHTIQPLWGAGNRQGAVGDVIWHCHLYPHFHEGMWGMFRTFDCLQDGSGEYPDGTPIKNLNPLPDRAAPDAPSDQFPGYPNFIKGLGAGVVGQRSPLPPWIDCKIPKGLDYRPPTHLEIDRLYQFKKLAEETGWDHLNTEPRPGWMFNVFRLPRPNEPLPVEDGYTIPTHFDPDDIIHLAVETQRLKYNEYCWHDPEGHLFRPVNEPNIETKGFPPNVKNTRGQHAFAHSDCGGSGGGHPHLTNTPGSGTLMLEPAVKYADHEKPLFMRGNHGDVLTLELENRLPRVFCLSPFDEPLPPCEKYTVPVSSRDGYHDHDRYWRADLTPPMQCGLHVHLVKFDPLVCDGASTGWNYLSGPRAPFYDEKEEVWRYLRMRYIWWVDEEFGTVFCHDHLFANFRQKRGLFGALIAEPHGSTFTAESGLTTRFGDQTVVTYRDRYNEKHSFREFCIGLGDFVPLYNRHNLPLNEPPLPGGHSDHGVVGINYHSTPIRERTKTAHDPTGDPHDHKKSDPAYCFSSEVWNDPDTPIFHSRPNEPIWIRLVQGSHEEQHSFQIHGMRWRRFRNDPASPLKNQQTLGISEAFTFKIEHGYEAGDYMYKFGSADDLWMGAWGIIRVGEEVSPLPAGSLNDASLIPKFDESKARRYRIVAEDCKIEYCANPAMSDPKGLIYWCESSAAPGENLPTYTGDYPPSPAELDGAARERKPLIMRCLKGEWIEVELWNKIPGHLSPEPQAPQVPVEIFDRPVSGQVSIHADMLAYDVKNSDGANIGKNPVQTIERLQKKTYRWFAFEEGAMLLQDFSDFRYHRHHGLIGALIVEPENSAPVAFTGDQTTIKNVGEEGVREGEFDEIVVIIQDGLRLYHFGNLSLPVGDPPADPGEPGPDPTDQGQKAFSYRAQPIGEPEWLNVEPSTKIFELKTGRPLRLRLVTAADKPRNHSFTVHGHTWLEWQHTNSNLHIGSKTSLSCGSVETLELHLAEIAGDYAYRSGALRWAVSQGLWGIIRLTE